MFCANFIFQTRSRSQRQSNMLSLDLVKDMLEKIQSLPENTSITK